VRKNAIMHAPVRGSVELRLHVLQGQGTMDFYPLKPYNDEASHWRGPKIGSESVSRSV
jgi:hypothetical protein